MRTPVRYVIQIQEVLGEEWTEWFAPFNVEHAPRGGTLLSGQLEDQTALFGILAKVRNLNLTLLSVHRIDTYVATT